MNDIFNLEQTEDLPAEMRKQVRRRRSFPAPRRDLYLGIFQLAEGRSLNAVEVMTGIYRTHKKQIKKTTVYAYMKHLELEGFLTRVAAGRYVMSEKGQKYANEL